MRRKDRELTDPAEIRAILEKAETCHLAMADSGVPYLVTMNFGIVGDRDPVLYFHSAGEGKKLEILKRNNVVCFAADIDRELLVSTSGTSCGCSMRYRSVTGMGCVTFVTGEAEKREALEAIMRHYGQPPPYSFKEEMVRGTTVLKLEIKEITGKRRA